MIVILVFSPRVGRPGEVRPEIRSEAVPVANEKPGAWRTNTPNQPHNTMSPTLTDETRRRLELGIIIVPINRNRRRHSRAVRAVTAAVVALTIAAVACLIFATPAS